MLVLNKKKGLIMPHHETVHHIATVCHKDSNQQTVGGLVGCYASREHDTPFIKIPDNAEIFFLSKYARVQLQSK
jgi:hypothetical protein